MKGKKNDGKEKGTACDCKIKYIYEKKQGKNSESAEFNFKWKIKMITIKKFNFSLEVI